jgi:hypothetical protein
MTTRRKITLYGRHNTEATIMLLDNKASARAMHRAELKLCGGGCNPPCRIDSHLAVGGLLGVQNPDGSYDFWPDNNR